jgi:integrase
MGLTKRKDSYYVEFHIHDNGKMLSLASKASGKLKRWKVGSLNKGQAKSQEAVIKTQLMAGQVQSPIAASANATTFREWAERYLQLEEVQKLRSFSTRKICVQHLVEFFGDRLLSSITSEDVRRYREQRKQYAAINCGKCGKRYLRRKRCECGWIREDMGTQPSIQTINHDHATLSTMFNIARSPEFRLVLDNPVQWVKKPNPRNERDRVASTSEWEAIQLQAAPHLKQFMTIAYNVGTRLSELLKLEWDDVDIRRREFKLRDTKNGEARIVPMTAEVYDVFSDLGKERRLDTQRVFLFKGKPIKSIRSAYLAACRRAGIVAVGEEGLRVHDFRHTASTNLRRAGVDTMTAMKIVGHKSEQMHRRYNRIAPEDLHEAASKLGVYHAKSSAMPTRDYEGVNTVITPAVSVVPSVHVNLGNYTVGA